MANKIFQILRNSTVYNDYTTAAAAFNVPADVTGLIDGQLKSARYVDGNTEKAIIGIWNSTTKKWSMIDIESSLLHAVLNAKEDATTKANAAKEAAIAASNVTLVQDGTLIYTLYQGTNDNKSEIGKINIPKDMVVESGSVITATNDDINNDSTVVVGKKYIKLVITNVEKPLYIAVNDLYKDHTAAKDATEVQVAISDNNEISATIVKVDASKVTLKNQGTNLQEALGTINTTLNNKQDVIDDLSTIRNKATTAYQKPEGGIPASDLANDVIPSFTIVDDHSGAGSDPNKIYIPSAKSEKETYDGLIDDEDVLAKALNDINDRLNNHVSNDLIHLTFGYNKDDFDALIESKVTLNKLIFGKVTTNDYVDLELPSGTIWAVKNLGATKVEEGGNRYMWGDPTIRNDKADFTIANCIYYDTSSGNIPGCLGHGYNGNVTTYMEKYLDPAYNTYNGAWHTPTKEQFDELIQASTSAEIAYINGVKVIKLNFSKGQYIYFPCTNCWYDNNDTGDAAYREEAYVMCNNIKGVFASRCIKLSYSNNKVTVSEYTDSIYYGIAVRPVLSL